MILFDENPKRMCLCNQALQKGIFTKTMSNDSFSIYGNVMQGKSILLNYNGKLLKNLDKNKYTKETIPNTYLYYCFDNNWNEKKIVNMSVCRQNSTLSYCAIIDIPNISYTNINIAFTNDDEKWDTDIKGTYYIRIYPDIEKNIMRRYGLDSTPPTLIPDTSPVITIDRIKSKIIQVLSIFNFTKKNKTI